MGCDHHSCNILVHVLAFPVPAGMLPAVTLAELHAADGVRDPSRILISLLGIVFDCSTEAGLEFFGPAGPYKSFAGRDALLGRVRLEINSLLANTISLIMTKKNWLYGLKIKRCSPRYQQVLD